MMSALSAAELGVAGYGDLSPYGALWEHHHHPHPSAYHHPHPADLLAAGFPPDLWSGGAQSHRMLPQRFGGVPVGGVGGGSLQGGLPAGLPDGPPKPGSTASLASLGSSHSSSSPSMGGAGGHGAAGGSSSSKKTRRRVATMAQRRAANIRKVPTFAYEKRLSRIETLRLAITYIAFMTELIGGDATCRTSPKAADSYTMGVGVPGQRPYAGYPLIQA